MLSLALQRPPYHRPAPMSRTVDKSGPNEDAVLLGRALAILRKRSGLSQATAGERAGMTGQGWFKYESGSAPTLFHPATQSRLTEALGFTPDDLERERLLLAGGARSATVTELKTWAETNRPSTLVIRDQVQAGAWLLADDTSQVEPRRHAFARDPRFPHAEQWLSEVFGDSVDRLGIFDRDLVHCVDFEGSGMGLQTGQIVEVERLRFGGSERELSIKQVELTPAGPLLWPRSSNPRWKEPLSMTAGAEDDEILVRIRGLIVQSIRRF